MKTFEEKWTAWIDGELTGAELVEFEASLPDKAAAVLRLLEALEEDDDVQQVYANFDIPTNVLERVSAQV